MRKGLTRGFIAITPYQWELQFLKTQGFDQRFEQGFDQSFDQRGSLCANEYR